MDFVVQVSLCLKVADEVMQVNLNVKGCGFCGPGKFVCSFGSWGNLNMKVCSFGESGKF